MFFYKYSVALFTCLLVSIVSVVLSATDKTHADSVPRSSDDLEVEREQEEVLTTSRDRMTRPSTARAGRDATLKLTSVDVRRRSSTGRRRASTTDRQRKREEEIVDVTELPVPIGRIADNDKGPSAASGAGSGRSESSEGGDAGDTASVSKTEGEQRVGDVDEPTESVSRKAKPAPDKSKKLRQDADTKEAPLTNSGKKLDELRPKKDRVVPKIQGPKAKEKSMQSKKADRGKHTTSTDPSSNNGEVDFSTNSLIDAEMADIDAIIDDVNARNNAILFGSSTEAGEKDYEEGRTRRRRGHDDNVEHNPTKRALRETDVDEEIRRLRARSLVRSGVDVHEPHYSSLEQMIRQSAVNERRYRQNLRSPGKYDLVRVRRAAKARKKSKRKDESMSTGGKRRSSRARTRKVNKQSKKLKPSKRAKPATAITPATRDNDENVDEQTQEESSSSEEIVEVPSSNGVPPYSIGSQAEDAADKVVATKENDRSSSGKSQQTSTTEKSKAQALLDHVKTLREEAKKAHEREVAELKRTAEEERKRKEAVAVELRRHRKEQEERRQQLQKSMENEKKRQAELRQMLITEREKEKDRLIKLGEQRLEEERLKKEAQRLERELQKFRELQRERGNLFDHKKRQEETLREKEVAELEVRRIAERQKALLQEEAQIRSQLVQLDKMIREGGPAVSDAMQGVASQQVVSSEKLAKKRVIGSSGSAADIDEPESEEEKD